MHKVDTKRLAKALSHCIVEYELSGQMIAVRAGITEKQVSWVKTKGTTKMTTLFAIANALLEINPEAAKSFWTYLHGEI